MMTVPAAPDFEQRVYERIRRADWHPFRPLKVFCIDGEWVMAFRQSRRAVAFEIHPTRADAFQGAEAIAQAIREEYPCGHA